MSDFNPAIQTEIEELTEELLEDLLVQSPEIIEKGLKILERQKKLQVE